MTGSCNVISDKCRDLDILYIFCIFVTIINYICIRNTITMLGTSFHFSLWNTQSCRLSESVGPLLSKVVVVRTEDHRLHGGVRQLEHQAGRHPLVQLKVFLKSFNFKDSGH